MTKSGNFSRFYSLLAKMPGADKEDLVWSASGMLTTSLREFYERNPEGYKRMITNMQVTVDHTRVNTEQKAAIRMLRSAILKRLQKHGVDTTSWARVNQFLNQPRIAGKMLYEMNIEEMTALITKLEAILAKESKIKENERNLTLMN